jgi:hypothetical protein
MICKPFKIGNENFFVSVNGDIFDKNMHKLISSSDTYGVKYFRNNPINLIVNTIFKGEER